MNTQAKETLKIVVVGHVDHGKSTVIGRLLYDTRSLPDGAIERAKEISKNNGKPFEYAYLLDAFEEEQKQGITIDTTQLQFHTAKRDYVIIDAPGHKEFLKNMISGAASAEAALLIIDANEGIQEQSKRHGYILSLLGIQKIYVLVNKMDLIDYSETKFNAIKERMNDFLGSLNVFPLRYIPVSAFHGENIAARSDKMQWYKGEPLLAALDLFEKGHELDKKALRFPIQDVYKFDHRRIIAGRIESGTLQEGDEILILPSNKRTRVKSLEYWQTTDKKNAASSGMPVGITLEDEFFNQRGEFIVHPDSAAHVADVFKANIIWLGRQPLVKQKEYKLKLATQEVECEIQSILLAIDAATLQQVENADGVKTNDVAEVILRTKREICFDNFKHNAHTGRFVIVDGFDVCGGGIVSGRISALEDSSKLVQGDTAVKVHCFDEYYFNLTEGTVRRIAARAHTFSAGDALPLEGKTYVYPEDIDILDIAASRFARIRKGRLDDIRDLSRYEYANVPLINTRGFGVKVTSGEDWQNFRRDIATESLADQTAFSNKWLEFAKYRIIRFGNDSGAGNEDYRI